MKDDALVAKAVCGTSQAQIADYFLLRYLACVLAPVLHLPTYQYMMCSAWCC